MAITEAAKDLDIRKSERKCNANNGHATSGNASDTIVLLHRIVLTSPAATEYYGQSLCDR